MESLSFTIRFKTPFAITSGAAGDGLDSRIDDEDLLPASSLKGLMRAEAATTLSIPPDLVAELFGRAGVASPWAWTDAELERSWVERRARLKIIGEGRAGEGSLLMAEYVWANRGSFGVHQLKGLTPGELGAHLIILRAAARSITSLGAARRRGQGWVDVTDETDWTAADTALLLESRGRADG